ncbi:hypothetical protein GE09DRAFT_1050051 [Coniochaeta sp. 2T2.1]|nr:hypothetical protein GE09DRAFT_1050051 [Coniochaeta sp. 2T2.1]
MNFLSSRVRRQRQEKVPLLGLGPDGTLMHSEAEEYGDLSSGDSSPVASTHGEQEPSSPRALKLQFGALPDPPQDLSHREAEQLTKLDRKIHEALRDLSSREAEFLQAVKISKDAIKEVKKLDNAYNKEMMKAPVPPPMGTWFQQERKLYSEKKAEHTEKLKSILRLRGEAIENDLIKAQKQVRDMKQAVDGAKAKYDRLRAERQRITREGQIGVTGQSSLI